MQLNKLTPNISKTKLMIFNAKQPNVLPLILFNNEKVEYVDSCLLYTSDAADE